MTISPFSISPVTVLLSAKELLCEGGLGQCMRQIRTRDPEAKWCTPSRMEMSAKHSPLTEIQVSTTSVAVLRITKFSFRFTWSIQLLKNRIQYFQMSRTRVRGILREFYLLIALPFIRLTRLIIMVNWTVDLCVCRRLLFLPSLPSPTPLCPTLWVHISLNLQSRRTQDKIESL